MCYICFSGRRLSLFCLLWSQSSVWNRPWGPSSPTSPWSVHLALSIWSTSWKSELPTVYIQISCVLFFPSYKSPLYTFPPPLRHQLSVNYTGVSCVTYIYIFFLSVLSPQHPALRGHCVHVPVPRRRQVHVPLPSSKKGGHEQQWGEERDLGRGWALFVTRTEAHKPASMRKQPLRIKMGKMDGLGKTESRLVHLRWANAKVYHIVPLEQRKLCTTQRIYLTCLFLSFLFVWVVVFLFFLKFV